LIKIDVKNIAGSEERFKNRVKSTGRVLYSVSKKIWARDGLHNFPTNVLRLAQAIRPQSDGDIPQQVFYGSYAG